jgi:hypothetical protein
MTEGQARRRRPWVVATSAVAGLVVIAGDGFVDPDPELERKALKTFAAASAARHGCPAPTYP